MNSHRRHIEKRRARLRAKLLGMFSSIPWRLHDSILEADQEIIRSVSTQFYLDNVGLRPD